MMSFAIPFSILVISHCPSSRFLRDGERSEVNVEEGSEVLEICSLLCHSEGGTTEESSQLKFQLFFF